MAKEKNEDKEEQTGQPKGILDGSKESAKEKVDNTKQKVQKIKRIIEFLKRHPLIAKMLFWVILAIIVIVLFTMILYTVLGKKESDASISLDSVISNMQKIDKEVQDGEEEEENESNTQKMTAGTIREEDGKYFYELLYGEDSEEKNKERINKVKAELGKKNIEIYDNHCLLFLAVMQENGLDITDYKKQDLEAMYMFLKAEIATSSLDLGTEGETLENRVVPEGGTYSKDNYNENDFSNDRIKGTIKVQRVTYNKAATSGEIGDSTQLKYIPLEEFEAKIQAKDMTVKNYFTLDKENNLLVAGWRSNSIDYDVTDYTIDGVENEEEKNKLQEYYDGDDVEHGEISVYKYRSIPYLNYISKYTMPFSFLMSLLATTDDAEFCKEVAKISEKSSITITLHEEYSKTTTTATNVHDEIQKVYATIDAEVGGTVKEDEEWEYETLEPNFNPSTILNNNHWQNGRNKNRTGGGNASSYNQTFTWEYGNTQYELHISGTQNVYNIENCYFRHKVINSETETKESTITNRFITKDRKIQNAKPGEINRLTALTAEEYIDHIDWFENLQNNTVTRNKKYTVVTTTISEFNSYSMEVTEVDNWYEYYKKSYSEVEEENVPYPENDTEVSIIPSINTVTITDSSEIENMSYIKEISEDEKNRVIGEAIGENEFTDPVFNITKLEEQIFSYGKENIHTTIEEQRYKRAGTEKELVQVKVQKNNETALLSIAADAFGTQEKKEEESGTEKREKEEVYETTQIMSNSLLYVYDKYEDVQDTMKSIDEWTYEMLDKRATCKGMTELLKYLIFLYDGTDLGTTEYNLTLLHPSEFKIGNKVNNAIAEILKSYENNDLRKYMNNESNDYDSVKDFVKQDKSQYKLYYTSFDGCLNFSYGIVVQSKAGRLNNEEKFEEEGIDLKDLINQYNQGQDVYVDVEIVDRIFLSIIKDKKDSISKIFKDAGLSIKDHELDALVNVAYQWGNCGQYLSGEDNITQVYKKYIIDPEEPDYDGFFNNAKCQTDGGTARFFITGQYALREENNRILFKEGRYFLPDGTEIFSGSAVVEFALQFVGENHERFTSYEPTNGVANVWYNADWCAMFVSYCFNECGLIPAILPQPFNACSPSNAGAEDFFIYRKEQPEYIPQPGDIIMFVNSAGSCYHTGIVTSCDGTNVYTVEGNAGESTSSPFWKGSQVIETEYLINSTNILGYIPINR